MDVYKGAVFPPNEAERMETFNAIGLGSAPQDPTTARLCHVLSKLLQVHLVFILRAGMVVFMDALSPFLAHARCQQLMEVISPSSI